jgi:adenylate cyclase
MGRRVMGIGWALSALVLLAVAFTAAIIHLSWSWAAAQNVALLVDRLNREIAQTVDRELIGTFEGARGAAEATRSILYQGAVKADDEARREFVFLSILRSQPAISWVAFGFPDGRFFGAQKRSDGEIHMVELYGVAEDGILQLRRDRYDPLPGDAMFKAREFAAERFFVAVQPWYKSAVATGTSAWSLAEQFPNGGHRAVVVSAPVELYHRFIGVLAVAIELDQLSTFLGKLDIARSSLVVALDDQGQVMASSAPTGPLFTALHKAVSAVPPDATTVEIAGPNASTFVTLSALEFRGWRLATAIPRPVFYSAIDRNRNRLLIILALLAVISAAGATLSANRLIARPIGAITAELAHIESFALDRVRRVPSRLSELDSLSDALQRMARVLLSFSRYMPTDLVRSLLAQGVAVRPGGEVRELTIMFCDLPGFTTLTEELGPAVGPYLTEFLTIASRAVHRHGGTIDKFIGDAVMAFWNAPGEEPLHALKACRAAIELRDAMRLLPRPGRGPGKSPSVRIGINTGPVLVGNIGSDERLSYTAIGDAVNIASRLEALGKEHDAEILIGEVTYEAIKDHACAREVGTIAIRGRQGRMVVYELLSLAGRRRADAGDKVISPGYVMQRTAPSVQPSDTTPI